MKHKYFPLFQYGEKHYLFEGLNVSYNTETLEAYLKKINKDALMVEVGNYQPHQKFRLDDYVAVSVKNDISEESVEEINKVCHNLYGWVFANFGVEFKIKSNDFLESETFNTLKQAQHFVKFNNFAYNQILILYEAKFSEEIIHYNFKTLYHLTDKKNFEKIKRNGLTHKTSTKFQSLQINSTLDRIYLGSDLNLIVKMFNQIKYFNNKESQKLYLRINPNLIVEFMKKYRLFYDVRAELSYFVIEPIHPKYLQYINVSNEWINLK